MNWKMWLKGLAAVAIGGAATGAAQALGLGRVDQSVAATAGIGALSTVLAYLMKSPLATTPEGVSPETGVQGRPAPDPAAGANSNESGR